MKKIESLTAIVDEKSTITCYGDDRKDDSQEENEKIEEGGVEVWDTNESQVKSSK